MSITTPLPGPASARSPKARTVPSRPTPPPRQDRRRPTRPLRASVTTTPEPALIRSPPATLDDAADQVTAGRDARGSAPAHPYRRGRASSTDAAQASDPSALCCSVVQAAVEVLRGIRPLTQMARWLSPEIYEALARRREVTTADGAPASTLQARIRRARVVRVSDSAAEATVIVQDHHRVRAAAIRVEHLRGSWRVVAFELA